MDMACSEPLPPNARPELLLKAVSSRPLFGPAPAPRETVPDTFALPSLPSTVFTSAYHVSQWIMVSKGSRHPGLKRVPCV